MIAEKYLQKDPTVPFYTQEQAATRIPFYTFSKYMKVEVPPLDWIVEGVLVEGSAVIFSAREKAGKGLLMLDLLISVATGTPFLDRAVKEGPCLYLALEESMRTLQMRLRARWPSMVDIPLFIAQMDVSPDDDEPFYIDSKEGVERLAELIQVLQPVVIVIDTLREAHRGRENESDDMAPRLKAIRDLAHTHNVTIIFTHHAAKQTGGSRGSSAIRAAFDDSIEFVREDNDSEQEIRGLLHAEGRNVPKMVERISFDTTTFRWNANGAPPAEANPGVRQRILQELDATQEWMDAKALSAAIPDFKLKTVQNELSRMMQESTRPFAVDPEIARKGSPRRFHTLQPSIVPPDDPGTIGNDGKSVETASRLRVVDFEEGEV